MPQVSVILNAADGFGNSGQIQVNEKQIRTFCLGETNQIAAIDRLNNSEAL